MTISPDHILLLVTLTSRLARYVDTIAQTADISPEKLADAKARGEASDAAFDRRVEEALQRLRGDE